MSDHYLTCGTSAVEGCHHLEPLDLADSRDAFEAMVEHKMRCNGPRSRRQAERIVRGNTSMIDEYAARTRFERPCRSLADHDPHAQCFGNGPFRRVPSMQQTSSGSWVSPVPGWDKS